jgi:hypothetical protein
MTVQLNSFSNLPDQSHQPIKPEVAHEASLNGSLGAHLLTGLLPLHHDFGAISGGGQIKHLIRHHFFSKMDAVEITSIFPGEIVEV